MAPARQRHAWLLGGTLALLLMSAVGLSLAAAPPKNPGEAARPRPGERARRLHTLGVAYMNQQRFEKALQLFRQAYALDPKMHSARLNQGIALLNLQRFDAAREALAEAVKLQPANPRTWYNLGLLYRNSGDTQPALDAFNRAAELDPADADIQYFRGTLYTQAERFEEAIKALERAVELAPTHVSAEFALARAHQRAGDRERARRHLTRFDQLSKQKLGTPISLIYGEQGRYSLVELTEPSPAPPGAQIPVRFVNATTFAGLPRAAAVQTDELGAGGCFIDYDNDGRPDLLLLGSAGVRLFRNSPQGRFADGSAAAGFKQLAGAARGCAVGDFDNDLSPDIAVGFDDGVRLLRNAKGRFTDVTSASGLKAGRARNVTFLDYDHDGDLDLYAGGTMWRNNGNSTFTDVSAETALDDPSPAAAIGSDLNNDRAIDLVVSGGAAPLRAYFNPREGKFPVAALGGGTEKALGLAILDFNKDGRMDVAVTRAAAPALQLLRNEDGRSFEPIKLPDLQWERAWGVTALDFDNDGWLDLAAVGESASGAELRLLRNLGPRGFEDVSRSVGVRSIKLTSARALITADYDRDGDTDLLITHAGAPVLLRNDGGNRNGWLRVRLQGLNDNKTAIGTKVEVFAGTLWQKFEVQGSSGYLGHGSTEIIAGLGAEREADVLRLLWPTGVVQDEIQLPARRTHAVAEIDRRGSSCPVLFAWDGKAYRFVTDFIGAGIVGHWVAPAARNTPDPDEYVKIEGAHLQPQDGRYRLRVLEPMEEVVFLDQVRLLAVDHPEGTEVFPNEYFAGAPPFAEFKLITSRAARPPRRAVAEGVDVAELLAHRDRRFVNAFRDDVFRGFARLHSVEIELHEPHRGGPLRLLMHGLTDYFTATSVFAAHQAGVTAIVPYVEALTPHGQWVTVSDNIGFPAGLLRTMTVELTGKVPLGARALRITTNLKIYWDQVLIDTSAEAPVRVHEARLSSATLGFRGYPREHRGAVPADVSYSYEQVSRSGPYARHAGAYTRYGDVERLLGAADDGFVIMGSGDEVALEFDADLPPPPAGWKRDFLFFAHGYSKDMDFYEAHSATVEPLPYHDMPSYPYQRERAADEAYVNYRLEMNTRHESGGGTRSYRFEY